MQFPHHAIVVLVSQEINIQRDPGRVSPPVGFGSALIACYGGLSIIMRRTRVTPLNPIPVFEIEYLNTKINDQTIKVYHTEGMNLQEAVEFVPILKVSK